MSAIFYTELGANLREARKRMDMTQADLGQMIDLSRTSVVNIEAGKQHISVLTLCDIATALEVRPCCLIPLTDHVKGGQ